ncbi:hypothetical protein BCR36DRAFT_583921 [Piromyces finnis]|uniref:C5orf34-like C-terminal domain-containing protein n=1 Tax=Piromyces finnis TaxID=1754191 RepID=A0A1Y1V7U0_9FUNG|nr:hypothetical protein BCR36DRAFT_583921 [Piromyces finnis]|eukprot:ORX49327.1 hypothetical protein BCR36DRAFT_583921 [Piromyces finnis]
MKTDKTIFNKNIEQAILFNDTQEFSFYFHLENLLSLHFSKIGQSLLYEVPYDNNSNIHFPSHIRPSLLLSYSTIFQNNTSEIRSTTTSTTLSSFQKKYLNENENENHSNSSLKQPSIIHRQKTSFILSKYKNIVKEALQIRNTYSPYTYYPLEWIANEKDNWFRTNSRIEYVHWPFLSFQMEAISNKENHSSSDLINNSFLKKLNFTVTTNNTTIIQSLDKFVTITMAPHYQIFKVKYPIFLGKFSEDLFQYTQSEKVYSDSYRGQYTYYFITQEYSIKDIPEWCLYPLWLIQNYTKVNLSIQNPIQGIKKKDMIVEKLPQTFYSSTDDSILQSPPNFEKSRPIKLLYTPEAIYRLLPSNEIEIKVNEDETVFRTFGNDMTYLSIFYPERLGQEDLLKWKGDGRTFNSVITNHFSNKQYPLQKFLHQALIIYQSYDGGTSSSIQSQVLHKEQKSYTTTPSNFETNLMNSKCNLPFHLYNYGLDKTNMIPISPFLSSKIQEHLIINENEFWAYADGRVHVVFSDRIIISLKVNSDQCEIIQQNGEKVVFRLSNVFGYEYYIKIALDFAKWAFSTKSYREINKLKKLQAINRIRKEVYRNELFLFMTDYSRLKRQMNNDKIVSNLDDIMGMRRKIEDKSTNNEINYIKLSEFLSDIQEKNKHFLSQSSQ